VCLRIERASRPGNPTEKSVPIEITNRRRIEAARPRVFEAFAQPEQLTAWWGPAGFTSSIKEFDFRAGGSWRVILRGPDGAEFDSRFHFLEVVPLQKVVYEHVQARHNFVMTMLWSEVSPAVTELTWIMSLEQTPEHAAASEFISRANEQNFDRLGAFLL
jgi:uncharacterized protein YndB with AHSA1/START domain